jgi:hypothetical protein
MGYEIDPPEEEKPSAYGLSLFLFRVDTLF